MAGKEQKTKKIRKEFEKMGSIVYDIRKNIHKITSVKKEDLTKDFLYDNLKNIGIELGRFNINNGKIKDQFRIYNDDVTRRAYLSLLCMKIDKNVCNKTIEYVLEYIRDRINELNDKLGEDLSNSKWHQGYMSKKIKESLDFNGVTKVNDSYMNNHRESLRVEYTHVCCWCQKEFVSEIKDDELCLECSNSQAKYNFDRGVN